MDIYIPDIYQKSIYTIDYSKLFSSGIRCLLFDLDNTLAAPHCADMPNKAKDLIISLKQKGFKVIIFSNSPKMRVRKYRDFFGVDCVYMALKPFQRKFKKVISDYNFSVTEIAIIGDQLLTDIAGGNKLGIVTILVNPISLSDGFPTKINRFFERSIMKKLRSRDLFSKDRFYE